MTSSCSCRKQQLRVSREFRKCARRSSSETERHRRLLLRQFDLKTCLSVTYPRNSGIEAPVNGVHVAFKAGVRRNGRKILDRTLTDVRINTAVDPALFTRPQ